MRVDIYQDGKPDDDPLWECDLPAVPRVGDVITLSRIDDQVTGIVKCVQWVIAAGEFDFINVFLELM